MLISFCFQSRLARRRLKINIEIIALGSRIEKKLNILNQRMVCVYCKNIKVSLS